tara:strand:+ start:440 stop:1033 length:594 start_codon:yes stop_codon:yes gene_type:complete
MASLKISQLGAITTVASGDYFPIVRASGVTNQRVDIGVLDVRYAPSSSGDVAHEALASGNAALVDASTALASGNAAIPYADSTKLAISGGIIDGQLRSVVTALGANGSGIPVASGNYFTATLSTDSTVTFISPYPAGSYSLTYEVENTGGTITWDSSIKWPADTAPTLTTGKTHLFMFVTDNSGSTWRASSLVDYTT